MLHLRTESDPHSGRDVSAATSTNSLCQNPSQPPAAAGGWESQSVKGSSRTRADAAAAAAATTVSTKSPSKFGTFELGVTTSKKARTKEGNSGWLRGGRLRNSRASRENPVDSSAASHRLQNSHTSQTVTRQMRDAQTRAHEQSTMEQAEGGECNLVWSNRARATTIQYAFKYA